MNKLKTGLQFFGLDPDEHNVQVYEGYTPEQICLCFDKQFVREVSLIDSNTKTMLETIDEIQSTLSTVLTTEQQHQQSLYELNAKIQAKDQLISDIKDALKLTAVNEAERDKLIAAINDLMKQKGRLQEQYKLLIPSIYHGKQLEQRKAQLEGLVESILDDKNLEQLTEGMTQYLSSKKKYQDRLGKEYDTLHAKYDYLKSEHEQLLVDYKKKDIESKMKFVGNIEAENELFDLYKEQIKDLQQQLKEKCPPCIPSSSSMNQAVEENLREKIRQLQAENDQLKVSQSSSKIQVDGEQLLLCRQQLTSLEKQLQQQEVLVQKVRQFQSCKEESKDEYKCLLDTFEISAPVDKSKVKSVSLKPTSVAQVRGAEKFLQKQAQAAASRKKEENTSTSIKEEPTVRRSARLQQK